MFAKNLEAVFADLCRAGEISPNAADEFARRFDSLRAYGYLPQGRENRERPLADEQVAAAVLGLVCVEPGWAGHTVAVLKRLRPVGSIDDAFLRVPTLLKMISDLIGDPAARRAMIAVHISAAESGTNSRGSASVVYEVDGQRRQTHYVPNEAVSLLQPGAELKYDADLHHAAFARGVSFSKSFFERLARRVADHRARPVAAAGDGQEYDPGEAEAARRQRLGASASSRFLNIGVDNHVDWPKEEKLVEFDRYKLVLMPKTAQSVQSVHIDLHANRLTHDEARTVINRFLSVLCWCDDHFAIAQDGWSGNPVPVAVPRRNLAFTTTSFWHLDWKISESEEVRRALALYREARNAEENYMVSHAVLNYYKIIEIRHHRKPQSLPWVAEHLPAILDDPRDRHGIDEFLRACGDKDPAIYVYEACRVAVAHASPNYPSDSDDASELHRLHNAADIMRRLARRFITLELGVPGDRWQMPDGRSV